MHYVTRGEGKPILFLHGFPQFWFLWRRQLADLGEDHAVYAPDMRGYNLSCRPEDVEAYRMRHLLADVRELIDQLGLAPLTLVGHDWGGIVSWAFALKYPEMLERLVVIDGPPPFTWNRDLRESPKQRDAVNYMLEFSKPSPGPEDMLSANGFSLMDDLLLRIGGAGAQLSDEDRAAYHEAWAQPGALRGGLNYYRAARMGEQVAAGGVPEDYASKITSQTVDVPTLVIWGENDAALLPSLTRGLSEWVPGSARGDRLRRRPLGALRAPGRGQPPHPRVRRLAKGFGDVGSRIASAIVSACRIGATSWTRSMRAPLA